jgi:hypothetical protein
MSSFISTIDGFSSACLGAGAFVALAFGGLFAEVRGSDFFAAAGTRFPVQVGGGLFAGIVGGLLRVDATELDCGGVYATGRTTILLGLCITFFGGPGVLRAAFRACGRAALSSSLGFFLGLKASW